MSDQRIVIVVFGGRRENMVIQRHYIDRLLETYLRAEYHVWNLARNDSDNAYIRGLHDPDGRVLVWNDLYPGDNDWPIGCRRKLKRPRWCGCKDCRPAPYSDVYAWYAARPEYADAIFLKIDDDIVYLSTDTFGHVLDELAEHPNAVVSGAVVNNVVCAKHDPELRPILEKVYNPQTQRAWFDLHAEASFARISHDWWLQDWRDHLLRHSAQIIEKDMQGNLVVNETNLARDTVRSEPGERVSINTIAFTYATLLRLNAVIQHPKFKRLGDEGAVVQNFLPRIVRSFTSCHLYYGPQRIDMTDEELDTYRDRYAEVAREYLGLS